MFAQYRGFHRAGLGMCLATVIGEVANMKILLAIDDSKFSELALDACSELVNAGIVETVRILSVYEPQVPIAAEPVMISAHYYEELIDLRQDRTEEVVKSAAARLRQGTAGVEFEITTTVELGQPASVILAKADEWTPDLIIMGSHGRGFWGRLALGSVSDAVVHNAPCSVLVTRPHRVTASEV